MIVICLLVFGTLFFYWRAVGLLHKFHKFKIDLIHLFKDSNKESVSWEEVKQLLDKSTY